MLHCRKMKMVPGVPRHVLVSYISEPSIMVRLKEYLKTSQSINSYYYDLTKVLFSMCIGNDSLLMNYPFSCFCKRSLSGFQCVMIPVAKTNYGKVSD